MTSLVDRIGALAARVADEFNAVRGEIGGDGGDGGGGNGGIPIFPGFNASGDYDLITPLGCSFASSTNARSQNVIYLLRFVVRGSFVGMGCEVTTGVSGNLRLGLWGADADGYPDGLLFDSGNVSTSSAAIKRAMFPGGAMALDGVYWGGLLTQQSTTMRNMTTTNLGFTPNWTFNTTGVGTRLEDPFSFGSLPDTPAPNAANAAASQPAIALLAEVTRSL